MHKGTYYKISDRSGQIQRQVLISKGVRQGSVEGPLMFVACHDLVLHGIQERREAAELSSISARSRANRSGDEVVVLVNEIAFVDDLLSFLIFKSWEHLTGWIQAVIEVSRLTTSRPMSESWRSCWRQWDMETRARIVRLAPEKVVITVGGHKPVPKKKSSVRGCLP